MDVILNIQKKLNFYALQLFYFSSSLGENLSQSRASEHLLFGQKTKKNQKRKIIVFFLFAKHFPCFLFLFQMEEKNSLLFFTDDAPFRFFWRLNRGQFFVVVIVEIWFDG